MHLTVPDVAKLLNITEDTVHRWIKEHDLPATFTDGEYRFDREAILEWATASKITLSSAIFGEQDATSLPTLAQAIRAGGIHYNVRAENKDEALAEIVRSFDLPAAVDRQFLLSVLLAREAAASTGIGEGIAFPHVRNPIVLQVKQPMISLTFLARPIAFDAMDGKPVFALFTFVCPTVRTHLHLLSRLAFALRDRAFKDAIKARARPDVILDLAQTAETRMAQRAAPWKGP